MTLIEAVNDILTLLGEAPVQSVTPPYGASVAAAVTAIEAAARRLSERSFFFNTEIREFTPDGDGKIIVPAEVNQVLPYYPTDEHRYRIAGGLLYDLVGSTDVFTSPVTLRIVKKQTFDQLEAPAQAFCTAEAALHSLAGGAVDAEVRSAAQTRFLMASADFQRYVSPPGRYSILDSRTQYLFGPRR